MSCVDVDLPPEEQARAGLVVPLVPRTSMRYRDLMLTRDKPFRLTVGDPGAEFYAAHVQMNQRPRPGFRFELAAGGPWRWVGADGQVEATLVDVLAAANFAVLEGLPGSHRIRLSAVHQAHQTAIEFALADGDLELLRRLQGEQAMVAAPNLVSEEESADVQGRRRPGPEGDKPLKMSSLNNQRLMYKSAAPPVLIAGETRHKWFWARDQFQEWLRRRPGRAWREGHTFTFGTRRCPTCQRPDVAYSAKKNKLRRHKTHPGGPWCPTTTLPEASDGERPAAAAVQASPV
jgi:hypothetical protein